MIKPHYTLVFLAILGVLSFGLMFVVPDGGIQIAGVEVRYPTWEQFTREDTAQVVDVNAILRASHMSELEVDSNALKEDEAKQKAREKLLRTLELRKLQFAADDTIRLSRFAAALRGLSNGGRLRVLHYGDSQIEGDRITSYLREEWQSEYGGNGPGMIAAVPLAPNFSIRQTYSDNWARYTAFGRRDSNVRHDRYGYRSVMCRYTSPVLDSTASDTTMGWLEFKPSNQGYRHVRSYNKMRMYFGGHRRAFRLTVYVNDSIFTEEIIQPTPGLLSRTWSFNATPATIRMEFRGADSPNIFGISLEGNSGVTVDNIAMRGASGVVFTRMDRANFRQMLDAEPVHLVIYQYGGNTIPYLKDEDHTKQYGRRVQRQIAAIKQLVPDATIVMIGPSDMSTKDGTNYVTYDAVPWVRNEMRRIAMEEKVGFWDIYGAMGGMNSMPEWVKANPPLAGQDYIHFTPRGARQVATWLYEAFEREINPQNKVDSTRTSPETVNVP